jgi:hypothetical protein
MAQVKVIGKKIPKKEGAYYLRVSDIKTYHVIPNKEMWVDEKEYRNFKKYFKLAETTGNADVISTVNTDVNRNSKHSVVHPSKNVKFVEETIDLTKEIEEVKKDEESEKPKKRTNDYLEMKKKVSELGINTHGMKKADLIRVLLENGIVM